MGNSQPLVSDGSETRGISVVQNNTYFLHLIPPLPPKSKGTVGIKKKVYSRLVGYLSAQSIVGAVRWLWWAPGMNKSEVQTDFLNFEFWMRTIAYPKPR